MYKNFLNSVKQGIEGNAVWIPIGLKRLGNHIGITKNTYTVIAGYPGCGKTSFTDTCYLLNPYNYILQNEDKDIDIEWIYFSMERSVVHKIAKWVCQKLYVEDRIMIDTATILSWSEGKSKVDKHLYKKLISYTDYFERLKERLNIYDNPKDPKEIKKISELILLASGVVVMSMDDRIIINHDLVTNFEEDKYEINETSGEKQFYQDIKLFGRTIRVYEDQEFYVPKNNKKVTCIIQDHIGCVLGKDKKPTIDETSSNNRYLRDFYGAAPIVVSQMNRSMSDSIRRTKMEVLPELTDIKDSSSTAEDGDVVIGLMNPYKFKIQEILGYSVGKFKNREGENRFRTATVIKNTFGADDITVGLQFVGECGFFDEIPKPDEMRENDYSTIANPLVYKNYKTLSNTITEETLDNIGIDLL